MRLRIRVALVAAPTLLFASGIGALVLRDEASGRSDRAKAPVAVASGRTFSGSTRPGAGAGRAPSAVVLAPRAGSGPATLAKAETKLGPRADGPALPTGFKISTGARKDAAATKALAAGGAPSIQKDLGRIRRGLLNPDPRKRLAALRAARDLKAPDLEADVAILLQREKSVPIRRVATQVIAQGDATMNARLLDQLKKDKDPIVQLNAAFGLARAGSDADQNFLLGLFDASKKGAKDLLPIVASALEDPSIRAPAVVARFRKVAADPNAAPAARARAQQVLKAKGV